MKIGFDAKRAFMNYSGLGNYSRSVIESLAQYYADENYFLFTPEIKNENFKQIFVRKNVELIKSSAFSKSYWRSYAQVNDWNKLNLEVYHGLSNEIPFGLKRTETKTVVTIHDVIFKTHPEFYSLVDRSIYDFKTRYAVTHADKVIAISEQTKQELIKHYAVTSEKIKVIYLSLPDHITRLIADHAIEEVKKKHNLPEKFLLYVGTIEKRKNLLTVIKALQQMGEQAPPLVAVGRETKYLDEIKNYLNTLAIKPSVTFIHDATNEELNVLYSLAHVFIYTSLFEGFGIPLIESAAHAVPAITTKDSCMTEAAGKGALYIDPKSIAETVTAIAKLMNDTALHRQLSTLALSHSAMFNKKRMADEVMAIYSSL